MKYLIVSDSHGLDYELDDLLSEYKHFDGYIHCGDSELPKQYLSNFAAVIGNNDYNYLPEQIVVNVGNQKALVVHSHRQGIFDTKLKLAALAQEQGASFVFYGHTHVFNDEIVNGVRIMNPGSLWRSRDDSSRSYAIFEIDEDDNCTFTRYHL